MFWKWLVILRNWVKLGFIMDHEFNVDLVCNHYPKTFCKTITLISWIVHCQSCLRRKKRPCFLVQSSRMSKEKNKKDKVTCHHCGTDDHWRRKCKEYIEIVKGNKLIKVSTSSMFMIENYLSTLYISSWLLYIKCGFHICNNI